MMTEPTQTTLPADIREHMDKWLLRYPKEHKRSGVFEALRVMQERHGFLDEAQMDAVADYLGMPHIAVYEVATFYTMYYLNPVGKHVVNVCTNISCMLNGSEQILEHFENKLGIKLNETTADGKFTLKEVECLGACVSAPVCQIGKKYFVNLTKEKVDEIVAELKASGGIKHGE